MSSLLPHPLVLLIEDSEDDAFFFRWTLDKCGYECDVIHATDGESAIHQLEDCLSGKNARRPDLVFLDLKIPAINGFDVLTWIQDHKFDPPLSVSVLSGSEHAVDIQRAHALGAVAYYVKPLSMGQLRARIAGWQAKNAALHDKSSSSPASPRA